MGVHPNMERLEKLDQAAPYVAEPDQADGLPAQLAVYEPEVFTRPAWPERDAVHDHLAPERAVVS